MSAVEDEQTVAAKGVWQTPVLTTHGDVATLTTTSALAVPDGGGGSS